MRDRGESHIGYNAPPRHCKDADRLMAKKRTTQSAATTSTDSILLEPGRIAPDFTLPDQHGNRHRLKDYRGKWVVLYFYPKDNTTGCTSQACQFRDALLDFRKNDAVILGVSPDDTGSHQRFADKHNLPFTLLADTEQKVCTRYGVWQEKSMYGRKFMGVVRTTYLIAPDGRIAHRWDRVKVPNHAATVLAKLNELR